MHAMDCNSPEYRNLDQQADQQGDWIVQEFGIETSLYFDDIPKEEKHLTETTYRNSRFQEQLDLENETLLALARTAQETGCLLPLIKEELKCKIQAKRLASGQDELVIKEEKPKLIELSSEDIRKRELRKEQNRRAARRYRIKQREFVSHDRKEKMLLEAENFTLLTELAQLRQEKKRIEDVYQQHMKQCLFAETVCNIPEFIENPPVYF